MPLDLQVQAVSSPVNDAYPAADSLVNARFKLVGALLFLDGMKQKPLKALKRFAFESSFDACLAWADGPAVRIRFPDAATLDTFRVAVEQAQSKAYSGATPGVTPPQHGSLSSPATTPNMKDTSRRPRSEEWTTVATPAKRRAVATPAKSRGAVQVLGKRCDDEDEGMDDEPPPAPLVDAALTDEGRRKRREQAAQTAEIRAQATVQRGIGNAASAQRIRDRAERDELIGRITARYAMKGREVPWNLGGITLEELRGKLNS